jgi:tRNA-specific 2-thiouridylase
LAQKAESQEICFVTDDDYRSFLRANVPEYNERVREGNYINQHGQVLGKHMGFVNYTIGQRKGLGIALGHPAYVTHIDADTNRITLGTNEDMYASHLCFQIKTPLRPFRSDKPLTAKIRYRTTPVEAQLQVDNQQKTGEVCFSSPVWGITPGQSIVLYQDGLVIGGGIIQ